MIRKVLQVPCGPASATATVTVRGVVFEIDYDYEPEEAPTQFSPGSPERIDLIELRVGGQDVPEDLLSKKTVEQIKAEALTQMKEHAKEEKARYDDWLQLEHERRQEERKVAARG